MMKGIILTLILTIAVTTVANAENSEEKSCRQTESYNMEININALCSALGLNEDQKETVADFHNVFCTEMMIAGNAHSDERHSLVEYAVEKNITNMSYILTKEQHNKYITLLNATLANRGLR